MPIDSSTSSESNSYSSSSSSMSSSSNSSSSTSSTSSTSSSSSLIRPPEPPTTNDIMRALNTRLITDDGIDALMIDRRSSSTVDGGDFPPIQRGEFRDGTPYPKCLIALSDPESVGRTSGRTWNSKQLGNTTIATEVAISVYSRTDDEAELIGKEIFQSITRADLAVCGGQKLVTLVCRMTPSIVPLDDEFVCIMRFAVICDAEFNA